MSYEARPSLFMCGKNLQRRINRRGGAVKYVQACLCGSKNLESSFHHYGGPMKLVQACLCAEKNLQRRINRAGNTL